MAQRSGSTLIYLHGDQLGSVSLTTDVKGRLVSSQEFKPWGEVRSGGVAETKLNYTGQKLDGTGLLYYNARYYDPVLARFTSGDAIVPDGATVLIVDYHEPGAVGKINSNNKTLQGYGFPFQSDKSNDSSGPSAPQSIDRYSYVSNDPLKKTDPTGHTQFQGGRVYNRSRHHRVWVYGSIPWETFAKHFGCDTDVSKMNECWALKANENSNLGWKAIYGIPSESVAEGYYIQGWFSLDPGQGSYEYWGMIDADMVMADNGDKLAVCQVTCMGNEIAYGNSQGEYKLLNWQTGYIIDGPDGRATMEVYWTPDGRQPEFPSYDFWYFLSPVHSGWYGCDKDQGHSCWTDPYYMDQHFVRLPEWKQDYGNEYGGYP